MVLDTRDTAGATRAPYPHWPYSSGVCAECRYADLFAVQPRARCTHSEGSFSGLVLFAGQPSCADFAPIGVHDTRLSAGTDTTHQEAAPESRDVALDVAPSQAV